VIEQLHEVIEEIEQRWADKRLLVVGDVMLDKYIWGEVSRISPEAPVPVVRATHRREQPGGAANVAMNISRLGAQVEVIGFTGGDEGEQLLADCLSANGIFPDSWCRTAFRRSRSSGFWADSSRCCGWTTSGRARGRRETMTGCWRACWRTCRAATRWCSPITPREC
jgi:hypothetical protein